MDTFKLVMASISVIAVVYLLIKKHDTRTVLIGAGLILCLISMIPLTGLEAFTKRMISGGLIKAILSAMGFAYVMKYTGCDKHLVKLLTKPLRNVGFFLIPIAVVLTFLINISITSAAGCSAAVGATLIPVLMAAGVRPATAGAAVLAGTFGSLLSPGSAHVVFVAEMAKRSVPDIIGIHAPFTFAAGAISALVLSVMALIYKDYHKGKDFSKVEEKADAPEADNEEFHMVYALVPLVPLVILLIGSTPLQGYQFLAWTKMGVGEAMLIGAITAILVTRSSPEAVTKEFFNGMGTAYAQIMGIIIAASVFVSGLHATGAIDAIIAILKEANETVRWGGTFMPFAMGVITGSGDAATMAFNEAVTPFAHALGYDTENLGMAAAITGALGRTASPISGAAIVCAGIAQISPVELAKRSAPGMVLATLFIALVML